MYAYDGFGSPNGVNPARNCAETGPNGNVYDANDNYVSSSPLNYTTPTMSPASALFRHTR
jgi:hypothetical protein